MMRDRVGARDERSWVMRFHTQTAGSTLTAQQPSNNVVRTAYQALAAVLGGTQSLHTNSFDEALGLPTEESVMLALRTQQILGHESGVAGVIDPLAGSYYVETLTDSLEAVALALIEEIDRHGGAVAAIENGFQQRLIDDAAYQYASAVERGESVVVGVNRFAFDEHAEPPVLRVDPDLEPSQVAAVHSMRARRDDALVTAELAAVGAAARSGDNLLHPMKRALRAEATVGEVSETLMAEFGRYRPAG